MLEIKDGSFIQNGQKTNIYSGAMHYFRIMPDYWEDRLLKLKAAGLNTVETYVPWNKHEPHKGEFRFDGILDIVKFVETAEKLGLNIIIRPGPYICAEWDFGGFPAWLLADENLRLRSFNENYCKAVEDYFRVLIPKLVPHLATNGGGIVAMQVENEYGSFGSDKKYMHWLRDLMRSLGVDVLLFTADGESRYHFSGGGLPEEFMVANFGRYNPERFNDLKMLQPDKPLMCGEHWCGWFDKWGGEHHDGSAADLKMSLEGFFSENASFNLYMFHGGTNFGFTAGANFYETYSPTVTSYDYGAPLSENGAYTESYFTLREMMAEHLGKSLPELPPDSKTQHIGEVKLTKKASLFNNLDNISVLHKSHLPYFMEHYGQTGGAILYSTVIRGNYPDTELNAPGVHDIAYIYINGELKHIYDRRKLEGEDFYKESFSVPIEAFDGECRVDVLVYALGRVNFDKRIYDRKGIREIFVGGQLLADFDIRCMELDTAPPLTYGECNEYPCFMTGIFKADSKDDCFVDMKGFKNSVVYINGFNLGRILGEGPQRTLYLPGCLLKDENEITVLEFEGCEESSVTLTDKAIYI